MASVQRIDSVMELFLEKHKRDIHTAIRGRVVDVDYSIPSATVQPMASTDFEDGTTDAYPPIYDVPLQMVSGNGGKARLTVPIKPGDIVGLTFSERNESDTSDMSTHGLNAGWGITSVHSDSNPMQINPDNVELWNDKVHIEMTPSGDFKLQTPGGTLDVKSDGTFDFSNGAAKINASTGGTITMNGAKITPDGNIVTARGVNMNDFYDYFMRHTHHYYWTDGSGNDNTNAPNG